ncbi:hypothetical protein [Maledivibacter halophilus]|uniref:PrgI family protein n=1 Tax=Maledivibacter halophilus TaxID=36842 RepID=A0A1T5LVS2_9FIRM|nr:hypothetical protein [Maledivibacter halophilus]SKC80042.1 hypothetical protein SAMN02194393_03417 [Maledivibacter halophilus]
MKQNQSLYIPLGLKTRTELFEGFGKEELIKSAIVTLIAGGIDTIIYILTKNTTFSVVFILCSISAAVMMFTKDITNISAYDQMKFMIRFAKSQKVYKYKYLDEWDFKRLSNY